MTPTQTSAPVSAVFRIYLRALSKYRWLITAQIIAVLGAVFVAIAQPLALKSFVDQLVATKGAISTPVFWRLLEALGIIILLRAGNSVFWRVSGFIAANAHPKIYTDLMQMGFENILTHSYKFFADTFSGSLVRKVRGFASACLDIWEAFVWTIFPTFVMLIGVIVVLFLRQPILAVAVIIWLVLLGIMNAFVVRWKVKNDIDRAAQDSVVTGVISDVFTNSVNVRLFNGSGVEAKRFGGELKTQRFFKSHGWRIGELSRSIEGVFGTAMEAFGLGTVLYFVAKGTMTIGDVVLVQTYIFTVMDWMFNINQTTRRVFEGIADAKEMVDIIETEPDVLDKPGVKSFTVRAGSIEFERVGFNYNETRSVLKNFSLSIAPREKVAFVGSSGAGKTTLVKLLFRLYDVTSGKILIDGKDIEDMRQEDLRRAASLVPQDPILFHRSLKENIRYGKRNATDKEVIAAAKRARCHDFITSLPQGYDTLVGERGIKLSGGERQRVAIARAILRDAPILVLDEATSSLDSESESLIQDALHELMKDKTVIVIAHRLSTIMEMDRIVVMKDGKVVDQGTHDELLQKVGIYQKLWNIQAGGFQHT